ncbi:MAG: MFS transporter [Planctomycetaceae bacterium]|nr:MFS transporter [Planctomycetaceae bacterium]
MNASPPTTVSTETDDSPYGTGFWLAYAANLLLVCGNALTFRFAEFVNSLGTAEELLSGTEKLSGEIVRAGLIAAILFRLGLGRAIDHYGPRRMWLLSGLVLLSGDVGFLLVDHLSPALWIARIAYQVGLAGMFSCSIVHIQNQVPPHRRTEIIGSLGSSGFVGTIIGTQLSDLTFRFLPPGNPRFDAMFWGVLVLGVLHTLVVFRLTKGDRHARPEVTPGPFRLLLRYWPGPIVLVAFAMGTGFAVTTVFLTRFVTATGLGGFGMFFLPYSITAFGCRWVLRDWGTTFGRHKMVLWGLAGLTVGQMLFLCVTSDWLFVLPGVVCGFGHSLLFPAVVSIGAGRFPVQYRGSGTTLVLGFTELGTAVAAPLLGLLIDRGNRDEGTQGFAWMFAAASAIAGIVWVYYAFTAARHPDRDHSERTATRAADTVEAETDTGDLITVPAADPEPPLE